MLRALPCCLVIACAPPRAPQVADATAILGEMAATYAHAKTYVDRGEVTAVLDGKPVPERLAFATAFVRGDRFRFEFREQGSADAYVIWSGGGHTYVQRGGVYVDSSLAHALAVATGVSMGAARTIPRELMPSPDLGGGLEDVHGARVAGEEPIAGHACWHVVVDDREAHYELWIDRASHVVRRLAEKLHVDAGNAVLTTSYEPELDRDVRAGELAPLDLANVHDDRQPWVGVRFEPNTRRIVQVFAGSPAARGGLHPGDEVTSLDGQPIAISSDFVQRVGHAKVGAQIAVVVSRAGGDLHATLTLAERPDMDDLQRVALVDKPAPAFPQLAALAGHVVVLDFWATWCGPCQLAVPHLNELHHKYGELRVIGLSSDSDADMRAWVSAHHVEYPVARDDGDTVAGTYAVQALPTVVVIDKAGVVRSVEIGAGDFAALDALVGRLLKQ